MLTYLPPTIERIRGTKDMDAFEQVGEPIGIRHLCEGGIKSLFGHLPEPLTPVRIEIAARYL